MMKTFPVKFSPERIHPCTTLRFIWIGSILWGGGLFFTLKITVSKRRCSAGVRTAWWKVSLEDIGDLIPLHSALNPIPPVMVIRQEMSTRLNHHWAASNSARCTPLEETLASAVMQQNRIHYMYFAVIRRFSNLPGISKDISLLVLKWIKYLFSTVMGVMKGNFPMCFVLAVPSLHDCCPTYYTPSLRLKNRLSLFSSLSPKQKSIPFLYLLCRITKAMWFEFFVVMLENQKREDFG